MELLELIIKITVIVVNTLFLIRSLIKIWNNKILFQHLFFFIFYLFFTVPMLLQLIFPEHVYTNFVRANDGMNDVFANIIYDFFCIVFALIIQISAKKSKSRENVLCKCNPMVVNACTILMIFSLLYTIINNGIVNLLPYGSGYKGIANVNEVLMGCGTICFLVILGSRKYVTRFNLLLAIVLEFAFCWFVGKRYIVAETLIAAFIVLVLTSQISGKTFITLCIIGAISIMGFSIVYGIAFKGNYSSLTDYLMVDMSRQYTLIYQFHCMLIGKDISVNKFDAILYLLFFWVPRNVWADKPYPFVNQLTHSLISWGDTPSGANVGWATTVSIFSDFFDSFGFLGIVIVFALFIFLSKKINKMSKIHFLVITSYFAIRLITVQISSAIIQIVICYAVTFVFDNGYSSKIRLKRNRKYVSQKELALNTNSYEV